MADIGETVNKRLAAAIAKYAERPALSFKPPKSKEWQTLTFADIGERVRRLSLGLRALGVERGDRVAILSDNRPEWIIADLAAQAAGAASVPIYPTLPEPQVAYILQDSGAKAVIASDAKQLQKIDSARADCPDLRIVIVMDAGDASGDGALSFDSAMAKGDDANLDESFDARRDSVRPDELLCIIYTSGTTGSPKGVMLTQGNMIAAIDEGYDAFPQFRPPDELFLSFLPLSHIFERVVSTMTLAGGAQAYFNDSIFNLQQNMATLKPTIMACVPRVYESIHERVLDGVAKAPAKQQKIFHWAVGIGDAVARRKNRGKGAGPFLGLLEIFADRLVLGKIRARFGGRLKFLVSGGAPLNPKTGDFFHAIGIPILEVWGLTETALAGFNPFEHPKIGTVGRPGERTQVKVASDGELLIKGPSVMQGYWHLPEATAEAIDKDGWFHSGDIGEIDGDGYIKITDRKKDLLVLANGKKVAPQPIETALKQSPYVAEIVLLGDKTESVKALVVPNFDALKSWAKAQGNDKPTNETLVADPAVRKLIKSDLDKRSGHLADFEKIKRLALIDHAFSIESGELTPTLKVKRKVVAEKYGGLLEREKE